MKRAPRHLHFCAVCGEPYPCTLDCDDVQDGEPVCGPCAVKRFDAIKPPG